MSFIRETGDFLFKKYELLIEVTLEIPIRKGKSIKITHPRLYNLEITFGIHAFRFFKLSYAYV